MRLIHNSHACTGCELPGLLVAVMYSMYSTLEFYKAICGCDMHHSESGPPYLLSPLMAGRHLLNGRRCHHRRTGHTRAAPAGEALPPAPLAVPPPLMLPL
jgi:hypothetical protein